MIKGFRIQATVILSSPAFWDGEGSPQLAGGTASRPPTSRRGRACRTLVSPDCWPRGGRAGLQSLCENLVCLSFRELPFLLTGDDPSPEGFRPQGEESRTALKALKERYLAVS